MLARLRSLCVCSIGCPSHSSSDVRHLVTERQFDDLHFGWDCGKDCASALRGDGARMLSSGCVPFFALQACFGRHISPISINRAESLPCPLAKRIAESMVDGPWSGWDFPRGSSMTVSWVSIFKNDVDFLFNSACRQTSAGQGHLELKNFLARSSPYRHSLHWIADKIGSSRAL